MHQDTSIALINRIKRAEGHLKKVRKMIEESEYCPNIIHQSQAVQAALKKIDNLILESHLNTCVLLEIKSKSKKKEMIDEIVKVFEKKNSI